MTISSNGIIPKMNGGAVLKVRMFGGFQMSYRGEKFQIGKKQTAKAVRLLQMLLHAGAAGIAREQLLEDLFGHEAETDLANNLIVRWKWTPWRSCPYWSRQRAKKKMSA